jgi:hypothetical protein
MIPLVLESSWNTFFVKQGARIPKPMFNLSPINRKLADLAGLRHLWPALQERAEVIHIATLLNKLNWLLLAIFCVVAPRDANELFDVGAAGIRTKSVCRPSL